MSKIYTAFMHTGARVASGSLTTLRKKVSQFPDSSWAVYLFDLKNNVDTLITMMEGDVSKLPAQLVEHWKITTSGQVRKQDAPKASQ